MRPRDIDIAARFRGGETIRQIASVHGITFQAVHLRIQKMGISRLEGGIALLAKKKHEALTNKRDRGSMQTYGVSYQEKKLFDRKYPKQLSKYFKQKVNAMNRGIEWKINLREWIKIWEDSGHFHERARNGYVMARFGDVGPYEVGNVYICTASQNVKDYYKHSKRPVIRLDWNGESKTISEWATERGIPNQVLRGRLHQGWSVDRALGTKAKSYKTKS
jgi:hypothetical protein